MRDDELARIPTVDRFEEDMVDWENAMIDIRHNIDLLEQTGDPQFAIGARKFIAGVLSEIEQARHFIAVKREFLQNLAPAGVETLFLDDRSVRQIGVPEADHRSQGEDRVG